MRRIDIPAVALFHGMAVEELNDLDLSYTPPFGSPWDAVQMGAQEWVRAWNRSVGDPSPDAGASAPRAGG